VKINRRKFVAGIGSLTAIDLSSENGLAQERGERNPPQTTRAEEHAEESTTRSATHDHSQTERSNSEMRTAADSLYEGPDPFKEWLERHPLVEKRNPAIPEGFFPLKDNQGNQVFCSRLGTQSSGLRCYALGESEGTFDKVSNKASLIRNFAASRALGALAEAVIEDAGKIASKAAGILLGLATGPEANPPDRAVLHAVPDPRSYEQRPDFVGPKILR